MKQIPIEIIASIESVNIPSIPKVLLKVLRLVEEDHVSMKELAELVGRDPALSIRVFSIANSPAFRQISENRNLEQCLAVIGTSLLRTITACLAIQSVFTPDENNKNYDYSGFWKHSLLIAEIARELAFTVNYRDIEEVYLSALLHDVGQLLLLGGLGDKYGVILERCNDELSLLNVEDPLFGTDHAAVGAWQIDQWNFSSFMADAILFHHRHFNEIKIAGQLIQIIWSAHVIATDFQYEHPQEEQSPELTASMGMLGLNIDAVDNLLRHSSERVTLLAEELGISDENVKSIPQPKFIESNRHITDLIEKNTGQLEIESMVRDMAVMHPLQQNLADLGSEEEILFSLREAAGILFNMGAPALYTIHQDEQILTAAEIKGQPELLRQLEISIKPETCLAAVAFSGKQICSTDDDHYAHQISLIDRQIGRILKSNDLMYVPIRNRNRCLGLMIFGLDSDKRSKVRNQLGWITSFARLAAISIDNWRNLKLSEQIRDRAQQKIFEQQTKEAIHEACNPLGIIKNYLRIINKEVPDQPGVQQNLNIISEEIDRVTQIVRSMGYTGAISDAKVKLNLNELIEKMLAIYGEPLFTQKGILINTDLDPLLEPTFAEKNIIMQILLNLWKNASEAMSPGGSFSISTHNSHIYNGSNYIEIGISDTGPGLPEDVIKQIFQPLSSSKTPEHSGVGLSIVSSLVNTIHGHITFQSHADIGTTFSILLPR